MGYSDQKRATDRAILDALHGQHQGERLHRALPAIVVRHDDPRSRTLTSSDGPDEPGWGPSFEVDASILFGPMPSEGGR